MRRDKFKDKRSVRRIGLAFDFEWTNKNLFFKAYTRTQSFFRKLRNESAPANQHRPNWLCWNPFAIKLPAEVFGTPYTPPETSGDGKDRRNLRKAAQKLLLAAGWKVRSEDCRRQELWLFLRTVHQIGILFAKAPHRAAQ